MVSSVGQHRLYGGLTGLIRDIPFSGGRGGAVCLCKVEQAAVP